jgi:hypothetical protein
VEILEYEMQEERKGGKPSPDTFKRSAGEGEEGIYEFYQSELLLESAGSITEQRQSSQSSLPGALLHSGLHSQVSAGLTTA